MAIAAAGAEIMVKVGAGASNYQIFICVDPDPYLDYGSTKLLKMDPIWIRIRNTGIMLRRIRDLKPCGTDTI